MKGARIWMMLGAAAALVSPVAAQAAYASSRYLYIEQLSDMAGSCWQPDTGFTAFTCGGCRIVALADDNQRVSVIFVMGSTAKNVKNEEREKVEKMANKLAELFDLPNKPRITLSEDTPSAMLTYTMLFNQAKEKNSGLIDTTRLAALHYILSACNGSLRGWHGSGVSFWVVKNSMRLEVTVDMAHDLIEYAEVRIAAEQSAKFERSSKNVKEVVTGTTYGSGEARADLARELNAQRMVLAETSSDSYITWKAKVFRAGTEERIKEANKKGRTARDYIFEEINFPNEEAQLPKASLSSTRKIQRMNNTGESLKQGGSALGMTKDELDSSQSDKEEIGDLDFSDDAEEKATPASSKGAEPNAAQQAASSDTDTSQALTPQEALDAYIKRLDKIAGKP